MLNSFLYQLLWVFLVSSPEKTPKTESESLSTIGKVECPSGEHYDQCRLYCQKNCSNWEMPLICPAFCAPGCICDEGTVRAVNGQCIKTDECPENEDVFRESKDATSDIESCPPKEHLSQCEAHCQKSCSSYNQPIICPENCVKGCVCDEGLVRDASGLCVQPSQCPGKDECPSGEHYDQCMLYCQKNCSNWERPFICPAVCAPGCVCDQGTVRAVNGQCITTDECPENEVVFSESKDATSDSDFFDFYWSCEEGQIRGPDGRCKRLESETHTIEGGFTCPADEHFTRCDGYCQKTCKNHDQEVTCAKSCVWGCICDEGLVRGPGGKCIQTDKCPEKETQTTSAHDIVHDQDYHGCPSKRKCDEYCKATFHHGYGVCVGRRHLFCQCRL